jgi:hypothetical protein
MFRFESSICNISRAALLIALLARPANLLIAQTAPQPNSSTAPKLGSSKPAPQFKDEAADAARNATFWILSAPVVPILCFACAAVLAAIWILAAVKNRIKILTGTVTIDGTPAPHVKVHVVAASGYELALGCPGGMFTVYDIPDADIEVKLILSEAAGSPLAAGAAQELTYKVQKRGRRSLRLNVEVPLTPETQVTPISLTERTVVWKNPKPNPDPHRATLVYSYTAEIRMPGVPAYVPLSFSSAAGDNVATATKGSIVKLTAVLDGLSPSRHTYLPLS